MKDWRQLVEPEKRKFPVWGLAFLVLAIGGVALCFTSFPGKVKRGLAQIFGTRVVVREVPADEADIRRQIESRIRTEMDRKLAKATERIQREADARVAEIEDAYKSKPESTKLTLGTIRDVRLLRSDIPLVTEMELKQGGLASEERAMDDSYVASYILSLRAPKAASTMVELQTTAPELPAMLPGLGEHVVNAKVSDWYYQLYENKAERIRKQAHTFNELLSKHNFYDCETILEFTGRNGRKVFLMQSEMDVVSDGSDGDRLAVMPDAIVNSTNYQPFTSYGWPKRSKTPNPMVAGWNKRIANGTKELNDPATSAERKAWLRERIAYLKRGVADMKSRSFLIAEYDPFMVIPVNLLTSPKAYAPKVGDYAVIIHGNKLYPVIVGDGGPTFKVGEASLRMAKELNPKANPYSRPVSDLKVTYLVFPGSKDDKKGPPDYAKWRQRCGELLEDLGGLGEGYELHQWQDLLAKPEPTPPPVADPPPPADGGSAPAAGSAEPATSAPGTGQ